MKGKCTTMSDDINEFGHHPSTFKAVRTHTGGIEWDDHASVHLKQDGQGLFDMFKGLHRGTLAEMVALVARMPADERSKYVIQKAGDHKLGTSEIMALAQRDDFPLKGGAR